MALNMGPLHWQYSALTILAIAHFQYWFSRNYKKGTCAAYFI